MFGFFKPAKPQYPAFRQTLGELIYDTKPKPDVVALALVSAATEGLSREEAVRVVQWLMHQHDIKPHHI